MSISRPASPFIPSATASSSSSSSSSSSTGPRRPHNKARSVSSIPMRASSVSSSPVLPITRLPRSPPPPHRASSPMIPRHRSPTFSSVPGSRHGSPITRSRPLQSPSKLPGIDSMSYFPPFESMGSVAAGTEDDGNPPASAGSSSASSSAGPSRSSSQDRASDSSGSSSSRHGKGRSLGSLAGLMAWATFSPVNTPSGEVPPPPLRTTVSRMTRSPSDGDAVQALARRCSQTKRRVLEPLQTDADGSFVRRKQEQEGGQLAKKRNGSEVDVDKMLRSKRGHSRSHTLGEDEAVEKLVGYARAQRPHLSLPPHTLPQWRFPLPSPPVISLSPVIPIELFQNEISNPASTSSSPNKPSFPRIDLTLSSLPYRAQVQVGTGTESNSNCDIEPDAADHELDDIDSSLSPTTTSSSCSWSSHGNSRPCTPSHEAEIISANPNAVSNKFIVTPPLNRDEKNGDRIRPSSFSPPYLLDMSGKLTLQRTESQSSGKSCDSKETVKVKEGEITPRAGKGWRAVQAAAI